MGIILSLLSFCFDNLIKFAVIQALTRRGGQAL